MIEVEKFFTVLKMSLFVVTIRVRDKDGWLSFIDVKIRLHLRIINHVLIVAQVLVQVVIVVVFMSSVTITALIIFLTS